MSHYNSFTILSHEGLPIRGDEHVPPRPRAVVVIVHGFKGFKDWGFFPWLAEAVCRAGFVAVRFNMSRSGVGTDPATFERLDLFADDSYSTQVSDLERVIEHVQQQYAHLPLFLIGHSRGGGVALLTAGRVRHLCGVVTWSAIARVNRWDDATIAQWRRDGYMDVLNSRTGQMMRMSTRMLDDYEAHRRELDIVSAVGELRVPLLVVHGGNDESVPAGEAREIAERSSDSSLVIFQNAGHTYNAAHPLTEVPLALSLAVELTTRFINAYA